MKDNIDNNTCKDILNSVIVYNHVTKKERLIEKSKILILDEIGDIIIFPENEYNDSIILKSDLCIYYAINNINNLNPYTELLFKAIFLNQYMFQSVKEYFEKFMDFKDLSTGEKVFIGLIDLSINYLKKQHNKNIIWYNINNGFHPHLNIYLIRNELIKKVT